MTPDLATFRKLASQGNLIPVSAEIIADTETPVSAYRKIAFDDSGSPLPYSFLLESVEGGENIARYSFLGAGPVSVLVQKNGRAFLHESSGAKIRLEGKDIFERINSAIARYRPVKVPGLPPFSGGAVGYISYDIVGEFEKTVARPERAHMDLPEAVFMITDTLLAFDRVRHTIVIVAHAHIRDGVGTDQAYSEAVEKIEGLKRRLSRTVTMPLVEPPAGAAEPPFESNKGREEFCEIVRRTKKYIYDGDIIQAVLSQRFSVKTGVSPLSLHRALRILNPSPYMFLLNCADFSMVGASPEVHARCIGRSITVRPIAGTRKRGRTQEEDESLAKELLADPKERAEHIMLVDLARNDIGRVAEPGSVKVDQLMTIEKYSHVMHIVSNVTGRLREGLGTDSVMRATFPAGTLSGAPKVRAMQIISELEDERRGPYGGAVAYYSFHGNLDSCITIRTAVVKDGTAHVQAGAGIVADSVPESEYEETISKARAMMRALSLAESFEATKKARKCPARRKKAR